MGPWDAVLPEGGVMAERNLVRERRNIWKKEELAVVVKSVGMVRARLVPETGRERDPPDVLVIWAVCSPRISASPGQPLVSKVPMEPETRFLEESKDRALKRYLAQGMRLVSVKLWLVE